MHPWYRLILRKEDQTTDPLLTAVFYKLVDTVVHQSGLNALGLFHYLVYVAFRC